MFKTFIFSKRAGERVAYIHQNNKNNILNTRKAVEMNAAIRVTYHNPSVAIRMPSALSQVIEIGEVLAMAEVTTASGTLSMTMSAKGISNGFHRYASPFSWSTLFCNPRSLSTVNALLFELACLWNE